MKTPPEPLAIVGVGCRFPGGASSPTLFWNNLLAGKDCIIDIPPDRWEIERFYDSDRNKPGKMYVRSGGFLTENIYEFDALFFGVAPREAAAMDPQQRLLLEVSWEALEDAGIDPTNLAGSDTGVFVGGFMLDNKLTQLSPLNRHTIAANTAVGMTLTMLSNRLSYFYDLRGPSMTIDTACSASMVAFDQACQSLWNGTSQVALVGGVNVMHRPEIFIGLCKGGFLAEDGRSKSFDARADGYGRGEGAGIIVVKPLADAQRDGDHIYALIRATACNQDGRTDGITVPNPISQQQLIRRAAAKAGVALGDIQYFEAHGTGTAVGDPLEMAAIGGTIGQERSVDNPCIVGAVKSGIGHLEAASGVAGLIKSALCLKHGCVPPQANLNELNPAIPFEDLHIRIAQQAMPLAAGGLPVLAAINSFGYGGTNACAILQEYVPKPAEAADEASTEYNGRRFLLPLSARVRPALEALTDAYLQYLENNPGVDISDLCYSAGSRRAHHSHRVCVGGADVAELASQLKLYRDGQVCEGVVEGQVSQTPDRPVFVFSGMGPQWWGMGRELYATEPVFRQILESCDRLFQDLAGWSILEEMLKPESLSRIGETQIAQPANFVLQVSLVELLASWGIVPAAVIGHSVGEVTSAYVSGILTLKQALTVSFQRSRIQKKAAGQGSMMAVGLDQAAAESLIAAYDGSLSIAAVNAPTSITLAGDTKALTAIADQLEERGVFNRMLQVEVAYHSPTMEPLLNELRECLADLETSSPVLPVYSTVTGQAVGSESFDAKYWCRNVREPVYFYTALEQMLADGYRDFVEVGPHPVLSGSIRECIAKQDAGGMLIATLNRREPEQASLRATLATLYVHGYDPEWTALSSRRFRTEVGQNRHIIPVRPEYLKLPGYPWQRERHWNDAPQSQKDRLGQAVRHALLGAREDGPRLSWQRQINTAYLPYVPDHTVEGLTILPGAAYVEAALAACRELTDSDGGLLSNLRFHNAMVVERHDERQMQTCVNPQDGSFSIYSHTLQDCTVHMLHATGQLQRLQLVPPPALVIASLIEASTEELSADQVYAELDARGLQYGEYFRGVKKIWRRDGEVVARIEAHSRLQLPAADYQLHPTILDACFQSLLSAIPAQGNDGRQIYIPVSIGQLRCYARPGAVVYCHGRVDAMDGSSIRGDIRICDEQGRVVVEVLDLCCQSLRGAHDDPRQLLDKWAYQASWREIANHDEDAPRKVDATTCFVLIVKHEGRGLEMHQAISRDLMIPVVTLFAESAYRKISDREYCLDPTDPEQFARFVEDQRYFKDWSSVSLLYAQALEPDTDDPVGVSASTAALGFLQTVNALSLPVPLRVCLITCDAQRVMESDRCDGVSLSPIIGLARVAAAELPSLQCASVDIESTSLRASIKQIVDACVVGARESEIALRGERQFVFRLSRSQLDEAPRPRLYGIADSDNFQLAPAALAQASGVEYQAVSRRVPEPHEIEIEVQSAVFDAPNADEDILWEVSARIARAGGKVREWQPGDAVIVCYRGTLSRFVALDPTSALFAKRPAGWDPAAAAGALSALALAYRVLHDYGRVNTGSTLLVLGSDSTAGQALMLLGNTYGCNCVGITTHVPDAHTGRLFLDASDLMTRVRELAPEDGFDMVVTTSGQRPHIDIDALLAHRGAYIELLDAQDSTSAPLKLALGKFQVQLSRLDLIDEALASPTDLLPKLQSLLQSLLPRLAGEEIHLPASQKGGTRNRNAMAQVRSLSNVSASEIIGKPYAALRVRPNATYLITGGFGGFGLGMAHWLAAQGACHLVLASRSGAGNAAAQAAVDELRAAGVRVHAAAVDVAEAAPLQALLEHIASDMPPLAGVFHAAGLLDDQELLDMDGASLAKVMRPKALGAWHLHSLTRQLDL
ncbi:MAG: SDR family NAD(P)-dependent oxidoreductase, partial [Chromatiales bacterium]